MNIEKKLQKNGIIVKEKVNTDLVLKITNNISKRICEAFPEFNLNFDEIYSKLFVLNMYKAIIPEGMAEATYCYENSTIYFNCNIENDDLEEFAIHECIHFLQEIKDNDNKILKMGLSDYSKHNPFGVSINEAAVQLISSKIIGIPADFEKYYDIDIFTPSPSYYPVECALLNEIVYFIGFDKLFQSTFFSTDEFKNEIIKYSSLATYNKISKYFDLILKSEEKIIKINNKMKNSNSKLQNKMDSLRNSINTYFFELQDLLIHTFFTYEFKNISNLEQLDNFRKKLSNFKKIIGTSPNYTFYDNFYIEMMNKLEHKSNVLEYGCETALKRNIFTILDKLKLIILYKFSNKQNKENKKEN